MTEEWGRKPDKGPIDEEKPPNPDWELRRKINDCYGRNTEGKVVDEKPPDPVGVLGGKSTPKLELRGVLFYDFFAEAVKWSAALPSGAAGPSRQKLSYCGQAIRGRAIIGRAIVGRDYYESSYRSSNHCRLSRQRCSVDERRGRYGP